MHIHSHTQEDKHTRQVSFTECLPIPGPRTQTSRQLGTGFLCCSGCKEIGVPENALGPRVSEDLFASFARAGKMTICAVTCFVLSVLIITLSYLLTASGFPTPASSAPEPPRHLIVTCQPPEWRPGLLRMRCSPRSPATTPSPPQRTVPCD